MRDKDVGGSGEVKFVTAPCMCFYKDMMAIAVIAIGGAW